MVLGISPSRWQHLVEEATGELSAQEMEVLGLEVMSQSQGETIYQVKEDVTSRVGVPQQIVSDHGSDLNIAIKLYQQAQEQVRVTYDVTHQSALLLKGELEQDETYQAFATRCGSTRQQRWAESSVIFDATDPQSPLLQCRMPVGVGHFGAGVSTGSGFFPG